MTLRLFSPLLLVTKELFHEQVTSTMNPFGTIEGKYDERPWRIVSNSHTKQRGLPDRLKDDVSNVELQCRELRQTCVTCA